MNKILAAIVIFTCGVSLCYANELINPFTTEGNWYKGNLHTHTKLSDGDVNLPERVKQYRDKGYKVLAVTDHEKTNHVAGYSDANFLLISGMETHPKSNAETKYHLVCVNIPESLTFAKDVNANERVRQIKAAGGEVIFAHPYWSGHTINDMLAVNGIVGMEVYNSVCEESGKGHNEVQWDQILNTGKMLPAVADEDVHRSNDVGKSWTMFKAKDLSLNSIMDALRNGCFYSSCGPEIKDFRVDGNSIIIKCSPVVKIRFVGQNSYGKIVAADKNSTITSANYKLSDKLRWVRAEVVDANGMYAWTNPIELKSRH
jgi:predicted metal-dependent phosphoesterase TrpH